MDNKGLNIFLKALEKSLNTESIFVPRWASMINDKFPAYTKFILEVTEVKRATAIHKFTLERVENLSIPAYSSKEEAENKIKEGMVQNMIEQILKHYLYGRTV